MSAIPLMPGQRVRYGNQVWTVGAVGVTGGERYYWLTRKGEVAMLPWFVVEPNNSRLSQ